MKGMENIENFSFEEKETQEQSPLDSYLESMDSNSPLVARLQEAGLEVKNALFYIINERGLSFGAIEEDVEDESNAENIIGELEAWIESDPNKVSGDREIARMKEEQEAIAVRIEFLFSQDIS